MSEDPSLIKRVVRGNFIVEKRKAYKKIGNEWQLTDKEMIVIKKFFGKGFAQIKFLPSEVLGLIRAISEVDGIEIEAKKKEVKLK